MDCGVLRCSVSVLSTMAEGGQSSSLPSALRNLWTSNGLPEEFLRHLKLRGDADSVVNSSFLLGLAAQISIGLAGLSSAYLHYLRSGVEQDVSVDARHAALSFHSEAWYTVDEALPAGEVWDSIAGLYPTKGGGWVRIHTNFPHHRKGVLDLLRIAETAETQALRSQVAEALLAWDSEHLEDECARHGMCVAAMRSYGEWQKHPHAKALISVPPIEIRRVDEGTVPATKIADDSKNIRPLEGVKVLDLSRVLAGPVAGRALAAHGADVLLITSPNLPSLPFLDTETSLGKRTTQLDLTTPADRAKLTRLLSSADVLLQAYRPRGLEEKGFGVSDVLRLRQREAGGRGQALVFANLRAWGWDGPWSDRRGFDSLVQTTTGFNVDEGKAYSEYLGEKDGRGKGGEEEWKPRPLPMQALDHAAGYFLAFGVNVALSRMITEGGSWEVRVSLAAVGQWIRSLGRLSPRQAFGIGKPFPELGVPLQAELSALSIEWRERKGDDGKGEGRKMTALRHAAVLSRTPVREGILGENEDVDDDDWGAPMRLGADGFEKACTRWEVETRNLREG